MSSYVEPFSTPLFSKKKHIYSILSPNYYQLIVAPIEQLEYFLIMASSSRWGYEIDSEEPCDTATHYGVSLPPPQ